MLNLITQTYTDIDRVMPDESKITDLVDTKIIMKSGRSAAKEIGKALDLQPSDVDAITNFRQGQGVIFTNDNVIYLKFEASEKERLNYFNTNFEKK